MRGWEWKKMHPKLRPRTNIRCQARLLAHIIAEPDQPDIFNKRRNHESAKYNIVFDRDVLCINRCVVRPAGEDRLRSQRKFWAIQDLLLGEGPNPRSPDGRPH